MDHNNNNIVHSPFYRVDNIVIHIPVETVILCVVDGGRDRERRNRAKQWGGEGSVAQLNTEK